MVGVTNPLFRVPGSVRFHAGFTIGMLTSALFLSMLLVPLNLALGAAPTRSRVIVFSALAAALAIFDLLGRTPQLVRQVPQRFGLQGLPFGRLGIIYGADVGLYLTTQKTTSLLWVAILGSVLLGPPTAVAATLITVAAVYPLAIAVLSALGQEDIIDFTFWSGRTRTWTRMAQLLGAILLLGTSWLALTGPAWSS